MTRKGGLYSIQLLMNGEDIGMLERNARDADAAETACLYFCLK